MLLILFGFTKQVSVDRFFSYVALRDAIAAVVSKGHLRAWWWSVEVFKSPITLGDAVTKQLDGGGGVKSTFHFE